MAKRGAASELNDRNWDEEEEPEEAGMFKQASTDVLQSRVVKKAKRRGTQEQGGSGAAVFSGFGGFQAKSAAAKSEPTSVSFATGESALGKTSGAFGFGGASSLNGAEDRKRKGDASKDSSSYLHALKSLNESVLKWIKQHVDENPYIFLTPIFKDYQTHLDAIEAQKKESGDKPPSKESKTSGNGASSTVKPLSPPVAFQSSIPKSEASEAGTGKAETSGGSKPATATATATFGLSSSTSSTTETKPSMFGGLASSNGGFNFAKSSTTPAFNFGAKSDSAGAPSSTFGTSSFSFGSSTSGGLGSSQAGSSTFGSSSSAGASSSQGTSQDNDEEYVPPKPEVKEVKEDDALYSKRCKLYYQRDGQWIDRGVGNIHLKPVEEKKTQVLVRADTNLGNILLNIILSGTMPISRQGKNNVFLACIPNPSFGKTDEANDTPVPMLIRVKTGEEADELFAKLDERKQLLS